MPELPPEPLGANGPLSSEMSSSEAGFQLQFKGGSGPELKSISIDVVETGPEFRPRSRGEEKITLPERVVAASHDITDIEAAKTEVLQIGAHLVKPKTSVNQLEIVYLDDQQVRTAQRLDRACKDRHFKTVRIQFQQKRTFETMRLNFGVNRGGWHLDIIAGERAM